MGLGILRRPPIVLYGFSVWEYINKKYGCGNVWVTTYTKPLPSNVRLWVYPLPLIPKVLYMCLNRIKSVLV